MPALAPPERPPEEDGATVGSVGAEEEAGAVMEELVAGATNSVEVTLKQGIEPTNDEASTSV